MNKKRSRLNQRGFTLIELLSVMVIMSVMTSVAVKKFDFLSETASDRALKEAVKELNIRETLTWTNIKLSSAGWQNDGAVFTQMITDLTDYVWTAGPDASGGTLQFRSRSVELTRTASTPLSVGSWN